MHQPKIALKRLWKGSAKPTKVRKAPFRRGSGPFLSLLGFPKVQTSLKSFNPLSALGAQSVKDQTADFYLC